ncbi:MAG: tRNA-dihydrouridine synthase family protein, partial [Planctomycetota bacterium]
MQVRVGSWRKSFHNADMITISQSPHDQTSSPGRTDIDGTKTPRPAAFQPLSIGNVNIGFPVVQAALSGYSDLPMRVIARRLGAPYTICEVMLDQFLVALTKKQKTKHFLDIHPEEHPVGGQLMGAEPDQFSRGALKLVEAGFDIIDVNFGCPVKKVLGRCRGGFHLSQPDVAIEILKRTRDIVPEHIPVTVKMRRGIDDSSES